MLCFVIADQPLESQPLISNLSCRLVIPAGPGQVCWAGGRELKHPKPPTRIFSFNKLVKAKSLLAGILDLVSVTRHFLRDCHAYCTHLRKVTKVTNPISDFTFLSTSKSGKARIKNLFLDSQTGTYLNVNSWLNTYMKPLALSHSLFLIN